MFVGSEIIDDICKCLDPDIAFYLQWGSAE